MRRNNSQSKAFRPNKSISITKKYSPMHRNKTTNQQQQDGHNSPLLADHQHDQLFHKKQIEQTLNELHKLQSEIYELNVPDNPHSSGPIKKQIKQLSFLYENMTKAKAKNKLNIQMKDINNALKIMNQGIGAIQLKNQAQLQRQKRQQQRIKKQQKQQQQQQQQQQQVKQNKISLNISNNNKQSLSKPSQTTPSSQQIKLFNNNNNQPQPQPHQQKQQIPSKLLKKLMKQTFSSNHQFDISMISQSKESNNPIITSEEIFNFVNFNEYDNFSPAQEAYHVLLNQNGQFDFSMYNKINESLGLPKVTDEAVFKAAIGVEQDGQINFQTFKRVLSLEGNWI